jgi:hypothetical protein
MLPEAWTLLARSPEQVEVARNNGGRLTVWTLRPTDKGWRVFEILFSQPNPGCNLTRERHKSYVGQCEHFKGGCWDRQAHPKGIRLTDSRIDRTLKGFCL